MVLDVAVSDVVELEPAVETDEPAGETEQELCERWVDVEVVFARDVVGRELSEVHFVESGDMVFRLGAETRRMHMYSHDLVWMVDSEEAQRESEERQDRHECHARLLRLEERLNRESFPVSLCPPRTEYVSITAMTIPKYVSLTVRYAAARSSSASLLGLRG